MGWGLGPRVAQSCVLRSKDGSRLHFVFVFSNVESILYKRFSTLSAFLSRVTANIVFLFANCSRQYGPIRTRPYFAKLIDRCVNHKLSRVRTDDISGTNFRPGQTNIKGSDGLPLRRAVLEQRANPHWAIFCLIGRPIHEPKTKYGLVRIGPIAMVGRVINTRYYITNSAKFQVMTDYKNQRTFAKSGYCWTASSRSLLALERN